MHLDLRLFDWQPTFIPPCIRYVCSAKHGRVEELGYALGLWLDIQKKLNVKAQRDYG